MTWHSFSTSLAWHKEQILKCSGVLGTVYLPVSKRSQWFPRLAMVSGPCNLLTNNCLWMMYGYVHCTPIYLCRAPLTFRLPTYIYKTCSNILDIWFPHFYCSKCMRTSKYLELGMHCTMFLVAISRLLQHRSRDFVSWMGCKGHCIHKTSVFSYQ